MASLKRFVLGQKPPMQTDGIVTPDQRDKYLVPSGYVFSPQDVLSYITRAELGDTRFLYAFMDEMVARDTHLMAELGKAKMALTGSSVKILPYPVEFRQAKAKEAAKKRADAAKKSAPQPPAPPGTGKPAASFADPPTDTTAANNLPIQIADYIEQQLTAPHVRLDRCIGALSNGIFKGVGGVEVIVEPGKADGGRERLKALNPIPSQRFRYNPFGMELLLQLTGDPTDLVAVTDCGARIAVCVADADKPSPARRGILRTCIAMWVSRMYGPGWWLHFVEVFGSPMRIAKTASNDIDTINLLKAALEELGNTLYAVIPDTAKIELVEASARSLSLPPHQTLMDWNASEISKALLGATQTSQILSGAGSQASATVHMDVFQALTNARAVEIAATIREQIIMPMVERNFGPDAAAKYCPEIVLSTEGKESLDTLGKFCQAIKAAGGGKAVPLSYINEMGDIPVPEEGEPTLDDAPPPSNILPFPPGGAAGMKPGVGAKPGVKNGPGGVNAEPVNGDATGGRAGATDEEVDVAGFMDAVEAALQRAVKTAPKGAGEDIIAPVRAIIDRGVKEHASLSAILHQIKVRVGLAVKAPETKDLLASVIAEARFRGMQSAK
jgi:phage gp29-like protein